MSLRDCGKPEKHQRRRIKLLAKFGQAPAGSIVEADICPECGISVAATQLGLSDQGSYLIPERLTKIIEE
jgi:hypothetical protein